jgi:DNA repair exonuclease SbcCD ATPase subunit
MKNIILYIIPIFAVLIFSCNSEKSECESCNQRLQNDSLLLADMGSEMEEIDKELSKIAEFSVSSEKSTPDKIKDLGGIISNSLSKIKQLEETIAKSNSSFKNSPTLLKSLEAQKTMIQQQQELIKELVNKLKISDEEKSKLFKELGLSENTSGGQMAKAIKEILEKNKVEIAKTRAELDKAKTELDKKMSELNRVNSEIEKQKKDFQKKKDDDYFEIANELFALAEDKRPKDDMAVKAFNYYCELHKAGYYKALEKIQELKESKKLGKYVRGMECKY